MTTNPFTLSFGKKPIQYISRLEQTNQILDCFQSENPANQIFMITGIRGSGKTVLMTSISKELSKSKDWFVLELNPNRDILHSLAANLYDLPGMQKYFIEAKIDLSLFGIGISIDKAVPASDIEVAIQRMLGIIKSKNKRILVNIDEVSSTEYIKQFASAFQILLRKDLPVFLIMTGLYENIYNLQNDKSLTFLYRAPKILLEPLNCTAIAESYINIFNIDAELGYKMATLTKGYPFAFQVLGYLFFEDSSKNIDAILPSYDRYLEEYVYDKIWMELSPTDKKVLFAMINATDSKVKSIREELKMDSNQFSVYRERINRKGLIDTNEYGTINLTLPRFDIFVKKQEYLLAIS